MKVKRLEMRIVNFLVEYIIPDGLTEVETNQLIDGIYMPDELAYPKEVLNIDTVNTQLLAVICPDKEKGPVTDIKNFVSFITQSVSDRFPLEEVARELAIMDIEENYHISLQDDPKMRERKAYADLIKAREKFLYDRLFTLLEKLYNKSSSNTNNTDK